MELKRLKDQEEILKREHDKLLDTMGRKAYD
jgi:hypothetical protein